MKERSVCPGYILCHSAFKEDPAEVLLMPRRCTVDSSVSARPSRGQSGVSWWGGVGQAPHFDHFTVLGETRSHLHYPVSLYMLTVVDDLIVPLPSDRVHGAIHE